MIFSSITSIYSSVGPTIEKGALLVEDGRISAMGETLEAPENGEK